MPLRKIVTTTNVAQQLSKLPALNTPVMEDIYPQSVRDTHPSSIIKIEEISEIVKAVPVVRRGSSSVTIGGKGSSVSYIEVQPVDVNMPVGAHTLNDLKNLDQNAQQNWLRGRVDYARKIIRATSEALCAQSLSGKINFAMKTDAGLDSYVIDFGTVSIVTNTKKWDDGATTLGDIVSYLQTMAETIEENGGGTEVEFKVGKKAFAALSAKILALGNDTRIEAKVDGGTITLAGYRLTRYATRYWDPKTKAYKDVIDPKKVKAVAKDGGFAFRYLAIDDIDAGLKALPIYMKALKVEDPSGWKLMAHSKPLPIPDVKAMADGTVVS